MLTTENRLRKAEWDVRPVCIDVARRMVTKHHYAAGASNTATYLHGLFRAGEIFDEQCAGVAWWLPPTRSAAEATYPQNWQGVLCLSRLVILPDVPKNACTFLLSRSRRMINASDWPCLVTARKAGGNTRTHAEMLARGAVCIGSFAKHKFIKITTKTAASRAA